MADEYQEMQDETVFFFFRPVSSFFRAPRQGPARAPKGLIVGVVSFVSCLMSEFYSVL